MSLPSGQQNDGEDHEGQMVISSDDEEDDEGGGGMDEEIEADDHGDESAAVDEDEVIPDDSDEKLAAHSKDVFCLALSSSNKWLASGSEDDTAAVWDLAATGTDPYLRVTNHADSVNCLSFNASNTLLASGDMAGRIILTSLVDRTERCRIDEAVELEWMLWLPNADVLLAGTTEGSIWMWLISAKGVSQSKVFPIGTMSVCVAGSLLNNSSRLMGAYGDGQVRIWDLKQGSAVTASASSSPCCSLTIHPAKEIAAIGCMDGTVVLMNTLSGKVLWQQKLIDDTQKENGEGNDEEPHKNNSVEVVQFASDHPWLAAGTSNGTLAIYDFENGSERYLCHHDGMAVITCWWMTIGESLCVASACIDSAIRIWDARSGDPIKLLSGGGDEIYDVRLLSRDSQKRILTACANGSIRAFAIE